MVIKNFDLALLYWKCHLIPNCPLRSTFTWFLEQLLKGLVSWISPGKCSMTITFCEMLSGFCPASFGVLECAVSGAQFLTGGMFECDIPHCRSMTVLCILYKIRCNLKHPLNGALPGLYVPVWVTRSALVRLHLCTTSQYGRTFIPLSVLL